MGKPVDHPLNEAWVAASDAFPRGAAAAVISSLPGHVRAMLLDGCGSPNEAAAHLEQHAAEAWVAARAVRALGGPALARTLGGGSADPVARMQRAASDRRRTVKALDRALDRAIDGTPDRAIGGGATVSVGADAEALFPRSFSSRAQKRRGGVYTNPALVDLVLDLVGWKGEGRLLEPAAGAGAFLVRAWERALDAGTPPADLAERVVGNDVHPFACRAARTGIALAAARRGIDAEHLPQIAQADALLGPRGAPTEAHGAYEFVVGNPPWVRGERIPAELRARYKARAGDLGSGNVDLASYFVRRAFDWLAPGGSLGFLITQGLLEARSSAGLRAFLGRHTVEAIVSLEWAPAQFAEATVIPCVLVVSNRPPPPKHQVALGRAVGDGALEVRWTRVRQDSWLALTHETTRPWPLLLERGDLGFLARLRRAPTPLRAGYGLAVRTKTGARSLISEGPAPARFQAPRPLLDGREVRAWAIDARGRVIDYRPELISDPKTPAFFAGPKVVLARIALTPQAAVDDGPEPFYARNTVMIVRAPDTPLAGAPHAVAALINSLPVRAYAFLLLRAGVLAGSHRATLYSGMINGLPVPRRLLEDPACLKRVGHLGRRARDHAVAGRYEHLAATEAQIDAAVAEAFGLSARQLATLRARAAREPLRTILAPRRAGDPTRRIGVAEDAAGDRYR